MGRSYERVTADARVMWNAANFYGQDDRRYPSDFSKRQSRSHLTTNVMLRCWDSLCWRDSHRDPQSLYRDPGVPIRNSPGTPQKCWIRRRIHVSSNQPFDCFRATTTVHL